MNTKLKVTLAKSGYGVDITGAVATKCYEVLSFVAFLCVGIVRLVLR